MALEIRIVGSTDVQEPERYTSYTLQASCGTWSTTLEKRYSNFLELHRVMKLRFRLVPVRALPKFPGQKLFKQLFGGLSQSDVEERKSRLEEYIRLLEAHPCAWDSQYFIEFLALPPAVVRDWVLRHANTPSQT